MNALRSAVLATTVLLSATASVAGPTPQQKCQAGKNKAAGKYAACLAAAEKHVIVADSEKYQAAILKCGDKISEAWTRLETKAADAGASCPTTADLVPIAQFLQASELGVSTALSGLPLMLDPVTCAAQLDSLSDEVADLTGQVADLTTAVNDLESQMRCPTTGLAGSYSISIPAFGDTCTGTLSQSGSSLSFPVVCSNLGAISLTGSVAGSAVTLTDPAFAPCGGGALTVDFTFDNDCATADGSFSCLVTSGSLSAQRL